MNTDNTPKDRLEYLRGELRAERISYGELHELQTLAPHIAADDIELREAAGIPECEPDDDDAREWAALAREQIGPVAVRVRPTGCGEVGKPHPDSYRPDLPLRSALKTTSKRMSGHTGSNGVKHLGERVTRYPWPLTPDEKKTLAARPLTYINGAGQ